MKEFIFSPLSKTWLLDVDGTILKHNGYLHGGDEIIEGARELYSKISSSDKIILLTSRKEDYIEDLKKFLADNNLRYDLIISDLPHGERILINDKKSSGLKTAYAINKTRDKALDISFTIDSTL